MPASTSNKVQMEAELAEKKLKENSNTFNEIDDKFNQ